MLSSEHLKGMSEEEQQELQKKINKMTPEELKDFRNSMNPDSMGFDGEEAI